MFIGYVLHLVAGFFSIKGIKLFYPLKTSVSSPIMIREFNPHFLYYSLMAQKESPEIGKVMSYNAPVIAMSLSKASTKGCALATSKA